MRALLLAALPFLAYAAEPTADQFAFFEEKVRPVLVESCFACHSEAAPTPFAGLKLDSREAFEQGGDHGPVVTPGEPDSSPLIQAVRHETIQMPPSGRLPDEQIAALVRWVEMGAPYPATPPAADVPLGPNPARARAWTTHWAWQPVADPEPPAVRRADWASDALDRFILARLEAENLAPSRAADRRTLLRRLSYDLVGLPPTTEQIAAFEADRGPGAVERVVDSLLSSPHFGERWGRYWLDLARYSDTGAQNMRFPAPWSYRDWVIEALNRDLPYDRFVEMQLAADQLELDDPADERALGLITLGMNLPRATDVPENVDDRIDVVTRTFLGMTVACARCHDHKYDPIPTADYYSLYGVFENSPDSLEPRMVDKPAGGERADFFAARLRVRRQALDDFRQERLDELIAEFRSADWIERHLLGAWRGRDMTNTQVENLARENNLELYLLRRWRTFVNQQREAGTGLFAPFEGRESPNPLVNAAVAGATTPEEIAARYGELLERHDGSEPLPDPHAEQLRLALHADEAPPTVPFEDFWWIMTEGDSNTVKDLRWKYHGVAYDWGARGGPRLAMTIDERERLEPAYIFRRGNQHDKGELVPRRFLSALAGDDAPAFEHGAGRLDLARAITDGENPLTARVAVNRVWQHLFGAGLVRTPSDFGLRGDPPTHPELLDRLARDFIRDGWSTKRLIRRIVLSSTYRQSSADRPDAAEADPENRLLARMPRRRLDFEALRDSLLAISGRLAPEVGGASFELGARPAAPRRTIYAMVDRDALEATLKNFDFSDPNAHAPERSLTTVPQQALYLMNSPFAAEQARRVAAETAGDGPKRIHDLYVRVLGRRATPEELDLAQTFLAGAPVTPASEAATSPWSYGWGSVDPAAGRVTRFEPFEVFADDTWRAGWTLPAPEAGYASLTAGGGAPGDDLDHAVIRRWTAPRDATVRIDGRLNHALSNFGRRFDYSNGVRGWIVSSRQGVLAQWTLRGGAAEAAISGVEVRKRETLDFVVDARDDYEADDFTWAPTVAETSGEPESRLTWDAAADFAGPADRPLAPWERYAQALLLTNEFLFVD